MCYRRVLFFKIIVEGGGGDLRKGIVVVNETEGARYRKTIYATVMNVYLQNIHYNFI